MQQRHNLSIILAILMNASLHGMQQVLTQERQSEVTAQNFADEQAQAALNTLLLFEEQGVYKRITVSPDGELMASVDDDGLISIVDVNTGDKKSELPGHCGADLLVWSPKSSHLASHTPDGTICLWDVRTGECVAAVQLSSESEDNHKSCHEEFIAFLHYYKRSAMAAVFVAAAELLYKLSQ